MTLELARGVGERACELEARGVGERACELEK
jgi:hypothetical protein